MEDVPGVGKTTLAKALALSIDASFNRIQFTPDLLPADILGSSIYNPVTGSFDFRKGPIFCNVLLADEINRASPRTQSALLEAMSEQQATIEGFSHRLESPFFIIATENPVEFHGTYPLPEAQLDRFTCLLRLGYPHRAAERKILFSQAKQHPIDQLKPVVNGDVVAQIQESVKNIEVDERIADYIVAIVEQTRQDTRLRLGVSPRGSLSLFRMVQATALLSGRSMVLPDDVQERAVEVLSHRVLLTSKAKYSGIKREDIIADAVSVVPVPV
jgi:MoxR-like ATPase